MRTSSGNDSRTAEALPRTLIVENRHPCRQSDSWHFCEKFGLFASLHVVCVNPLCPCAYAFSYGIAFNPDDIEVVDTPIKCSIIQVEAYRLLCKLGDVGLREEDRGAGLKQRLNKFKAIPCFTLFQRIQEPLVKNQEFPFLQFACVSYPSLKGGQSHAGYCCPQAD